MRTFGTNERIAIGVAIVAAALLFFGGQIWHAFFGAPTEAPTTNVTASSTDATSSTVTTMQNISNIPGLEIYDEKVGTGDVAAPGHDVTVHYVGTLTDGTKFDSSLDRGQPFTFSLGAGQVIKGWDEGVAGMKVGGVRRLVISPELAYGNRAIGSIPANSTLVFEVQLLDVK